MQQTPAYLNLPACMLEVSLRGWVLETSCDNHVGCFAWM
jgi:hypothetical protein